MNPKALEDLFKPFELHFVGLDDLLESLGMEFKDFMKLDISLECSKSLDESCINTVCHYNLVKWHDDDLYVEAFNETLEEKKKS